MYRPPRYLLNRTVTILGSRFPAPVVVLSAVTLLASALAAVGLRTGQPWVAGLALAPDMVFAGQLWRLLSWPFFELEPISLLFACVVILFFGRDLSHQWGAARFLRIYFGLTLAVGLAVCLVGLLWPAVWHGRYLRAWPLADALILAWAVEFPGRQLLLYFVLPLGGRKLIYATVGITLLLAVFSGFALYVPHFLALGGMWAYQNAGGPGFWQRLRGGGWGNGGRRRRSSLRMVDRRERESEPPRWLH